MRNLFFPPLVLPLFFLLVILPFTILIFLLATSEVFKILFGISELEAMILFALIVIGSFINIPVYEKEGKEILKSVSFFGIIYYLRERKKIIVALNVGGAILPSILAIKVLTDVPFFPWIFSFLITSFAIYFYAKPIPRVGIVVPMFVPPIISILSSYIAISSFNLPISFLPKIAFSSGVLGSLLGADILHLKDIERVGSGVVSIGGAGTFDGIFLTGILAVIFSMWLVY